MYKGNSRCNIVHRLAERVFCVGMSLTYYVLMYYYKDPLSGYHFHPQISLLLPLIIVSKSEGRSRIKVFFNTFLLPLDYWSSSSMRVRKLLHLVHLSPSSPFLPSWSPVVPSSSFPLVSSLDLVVRDVWISNPRCRGLLRPNRARFDPFRVFLAIFGYLQRSSVALRILARSNGLNVFPSQLGIDLWGTAPVLEGEENSLGLFA